LAWVVLLTWVALILKAYICSSQLWARCEGRRGDCVAVRGDMDGCSHWHTGDGARVPLLVWLIWLLTSVTDMVGSVFSTSASTSFIPGLCLPPSLAAFLRRRRAGSAHSHAVITMRAKRPPTPATAMTAMTELETLPTNAVMVVVRCDLALC
jgi:hypothetical protein